MSDSEVARESHDSETFEIIGDDRDVVPDKTVAEEDESEDLKENGVTDLNKENGDICNGETELNKQNGIAHDPLETPEGDQQNKEESQEEDNVVTSETEYEKEPEHEPEPEPEPEPNVEDKIENEVDIPVTPSQEKKEEEVKSIEEPVTDITPVEIKVTQVSEPAVEDHQPEYRRKFGKSNVKPRISTKTKQPESLSIASRLALFEQACKGNSENNRKSEVVEHNEEPKKISGSVITQIEDKENQTKEPDSDHRPKRGPSRRLDMSRFSKFEQQKTDDSTDSVPAWKKNRGSVNSSAVINKFTQQNQDASLLNECKVCSKRVYPMERLTADGAAYHKFCFKCTECKSTLRLGNFAMAKGRLYCKPHFKQLFKLKGNYDEAFTVGADRPEFNVGEDGQNFSTNGVSQNTSETDGKEEEEVFDLKNRRSRFDGTEQASTTITKSAGPPLDFPVSGSAGQVAESEPIQRSDVVREGDTVEPTAVGSMMSLKDRFEQGKVSHVEVRKSFIPENENIVVDGNESSHISENQPLVRDGVVTSSQKLDEACTMQGGLRAVKDRFEAGKVSEDKELKAAKPIDLKAEVEATNASVRNSILAENEPITREGVVRSDDDVNEVKVITGGIGSLKNRFEKGGVSNIESVKKQEPERVIRSLENYTESESSVGHVAESTPIERADITRESTEVDDGIAHGGARSLRNIFEKGNVSNVTDKPKEKIEVRSEIEGAGQVAESQPIVRNDVVKANMEVSDEFNVGMSKSLKNKFETGEDLGSGDIHVSENTPAAQKEGVYRSSTIDDSVDSVEGGTRSLKEKWEKGDIVTITQDKQPLEREPKSIDLYKYDEGQVAENEPLVREGIHSSSSDLNETISPAAGAVELKSKWEKGEVHNAEIVVPKSDIKPKRLSDSFDEQEVNGNKEINGQVENGWTPDASISMS